MSPKMCRPRRCRNRKRVSGKRPGERCIVYTGAHPLLHTSHSVSLMARRVTRVHPPPAWPRKCIMHVRFSGVIRTGDETRGEREDLTRAHDKLHLLYLHEWNVYRATAVATFPARTLSMTIYMRVYRYIYIYILYMCVCIYTYIHASVSPSIYVTYYNNMYGYFLFFFVLFFVCSFWLDFVLTSVSLFVFEITLNGRDTENPRARNISNTRVEGGGGGEKNVNITFFASLDTVRRRTRVLFLSTRLRH